MSRILAHVDLNAFFASAERLRHPEWKGEAIVVGGEGPRAVVSTASYEARKLGVHSGMPMFEARRRAPRRGARSLRGTVMKSPFSYDRSIHYIGDVVRKTAFKKRFTFLQALFFRSREGVWGKV